MVAQMGFANLFARAGLIGSNYTKFSAISSNSGGSWFATQFFFAPEFFAKVTSNDDYSLRDLIVQWMQAYESIQAPVPSHIESLAASLNMSAATFYTLRQFNGSWADFIHAMLLATSTSSYNDPSFVNRPADPLNRVQSLTHTDLLIEMVLSPTAMSHNMSILSYIGPSSSINPNDPVFAVPISLAFTSSDAGSRYAYGVEPGALPLKVQWSGAPGSFRLSDWSPYYLYPMLNGSVMTLPMNATGSTQQVREFFGGLPPTVTQLAAASSTAGGALSSTNPSMLAQTLSLNLAMQDTRQGQIAVQVLGGIVYSSSFTNDIAVCSQWPNECDEQDARIVDGGYIDNNALVVNMADYQQSSNADLNQTLKIILTTANLLGSFGNRSLLSYFRNNYNEKVAPGDFVWPVSPLTNQSFTLTPIRSTQMFQEYLDEDSLATMRIPVPGTNLTSTHLKATTVDNPAYGIRAGQLVEILYLEINSNIPSSIFGVNDTRTLTPALVSLAKDISQVGRDTLLERIHLFLEETDDSGSSGGGTAAPSPSSSRSSRWSSSSIAFQLIGHVGTVAAMVVLDLA